MPYDGSVIPYSEFTGSIATTGAMTLTPNTAAGTQGSADTKIDTSQYGRWVSLQTNGTFGATIVFECSNDAVNWVGVILSRPDLGSSASSTNAANTVWMGTIPARYFRLRCSAYSSGTVGAVVEIHPMPVGGVVDTELVGNWVVGDGVSNATAAPPVNSFGSIYNGSTWDRWRAASALPNSGTGVAAVATGRVQISSLTAVTSTGAGSVQDFSVPMSKFTVQTTFTGSPTAVTVVLEGSLDNTFWYPLVGVAASAGELTAGGYAQFSADKPVRYLRANLTVLTGGTTPTVTAKIGASA